MRKGFWPHAAAIALALAPQAGWSEVAVLTRAETGFSQYTLEFVDAPALDGVTIDNTAQTLGAILRVGASVVVDAFYVDVYAHKTADATDTLTYPPPFGVTESVEGDRQEFAVSAGYQLGAGFSVFAGYRESETDVGGNLGTQYTFEHDGFFLGGAYSFAIADNTVLALNAGYADLDATLDNLFVGLLQANETGSGDGFKLGISSRTVLSDAWSLLLSADYLRFDYDLRAPARAGLSEPVTWNLQEQDIQFRVGLSYAF